MDVAARVVPLDLAEAFVISRGARRTVDVVQVEISHAGRLAYGEGAPIARYGESAESAQAYVEEYSELLGNDPFDLEAIMDTLPAREFAARAALDAALHDLQGKLLGRPVYQLLGLRQQSPPTSWTVWLGDPDEMARRAEKERGRFRRFKLKLGGRDGLDVERVRAVRAITAVPIQVDVNEAWSIDEALEALPALADLGVEYCEQPLPARDPNGPELKRRSPVPIFADEDCHTLSDIANCGEFASGITIKLAKSGGIREALRMVREAHLSGLRCMLGCMVESGLGIAAGAHIASLFEYVDLDGNILLARDPWSGVEFIDGVQVPSDRPGLGVEKI